MCNEYRFKQSLDRIAQEFAALNLPLHWADGFYEFTGAKSPKSKWLFSRADERELFCIAGLVREDRFTMLTCAPGADIAPYHDRQIVILHRRYWADWLGPAETQPPLEPLPPGSLKVEQIR
jgi:putative SOS response-associated peptidase YedK